MIISPPFLPDGDVNQNQSIDSFVDGLMGRMDRGKFPVSSHLRWHGGVHLQAPQSDEQSVKLVNRVPVRAIADGKILYVRQPTLEVSAPHPLNNMGQGGWCDDGCVVIQHDTEIGEELEVTFYSIYMHLKSIEATVTTGSEIHRKGKLGQAGQIYGNEGLIHFEIVADDDNTQKFLGDLAFTAPSYYINQYGCEQAFRAQNGRTDACFGSMYFFIPKSLPLCSRKKNSDNVFEGEGIDVSNVSSIISDSSGYEYIPTGQTVGDKSMYVEMSFDKGTCIFTSYDEDGKLIGDPVVTKGDSSYTDVVHEYNLYKASLKLYPSKPTAGFELLRFGRVIGDEDFEGTQSVTHFRKIQTPQGAFWIDLNNKNIKKYSDADFPYWKGWGVVNDDTKPTDGRSDSLIINKMIQENWQKKSISAQILLLTPTADRNVDTDYNEKTYQQKSELLDAELDEKMSKLFCKFPTEWQSSDFDTRYDWVKKEIFDNNEEQFEIFKKHVDALAFWEKAGLTLDKNHWHFPPIEFIKHFRKCGWLSLNEMKQLIPSHNVANNGWAAVPYNTAKDNNITAMNVDINKTLRKYCINTPLRLAAFFGNAIQETNMLSTLKEGDSQKAKTGIYARYAPWYGRGMLQLTWEENYIKYWKFRGLTIIEAQYGINREYLIDSSRKDSSDSAGFYWVYQDLHNIVPNKYADEQHNLERVTITGGHVYYRSMAFWRNAAGVNLPGAISRTNYHGINGFDSRCAVYGNALAVLTEVKFPDVKGSKILEFPEGYKQRQINEKPQVTKNSSHHR